MDYKDLIEDLNKESEWYAITDRNVDYIMMQAATAITELLNRAEEAEMERDAAVEQLHGYCAACKHYTSNHFEGPCDSCKHEYYQYVDHNAEDNWQWRGIKEE